VVIVCIETGIHFQMIAAISPALIAGPPLAEAGKSMKPWFWARAEDRHTQTPPQPLVPRNSQTSKSPRRAGNPQSILLASCHDFIILSSASTLFSFFPRPHRATQERKPSPEIAVSTPLPWPILPQVSWLASPKAPPPRTPTTLRLSPSYTLLWCP